VVRKSVSGKAGSNLGDRNEKVVIVEKVSSYIRENPSSGLSLESLEKTFQISRYTIQKAFMEIMGISPRKYVEECRIHVLKQNIRKGDPVPRAIYNVGYNSQNWLYRDPSSKLGMSLSAYRNGGKGVEIRYLTAPCKLGYLIVAETDRGICSVSMADSPEQLVEHLKQEFPNATMTDSESVRKSIAAILDYFEGKMLKLPLDIDGTEFQKRVWAAISRIPYGETKSYNRIAEEIGMPNAYRAVANACGANPVPLIVPCHRVIRKNGGLGGYGMGIGRKEYLLKMEKAKSQQLRSNKQMTESS